jgi:hypothetical protein
MSLGAVTGSVETQHIEGQARISFVPKTAPDHMLGARQTMPDEHFTCQTLTNVNTDLDVG